MGTSSRVSCFSKSNFFSSRKAKDMDALPCILNKVIVTLNRGEEHIFKLQRKNLKNDLFNLMGIDVMEEYHKKKLLYDKYCDKMLKRRKSPKITNCDVLTKKGPITLKVYREDGTDEVVSNFKTIMEYLNQTEKELKINLSKPLKEQDTLNELNNLANKKIKRTDDLKDHSRSTKKHKSSVQHEEEANRSIFTSVSAAVPKKTEEGLCKELQFSMVDNSKLSVVYLLNRS
ncbi:hypothetical protein Tco_0678484 [Tanacetum coccineum]|uniref:Uncharacterized protein n=1 Tax=Tanacetum coccineum TaxID=301880 RepID=A0ABQ4XFU8_9ASTR